MGGSWRPRQWGVLLAYLWYAGGRADACRIALRLPASLPGVANKYWSTSSTRAVFWRERQGGGRLLWDFDATVVGWGRQRYAARTVGPLGFLDLRQYVGTGWSMRGQHPPAGFRVARRSQTGRAELALVMGGDSCDRRGLLCSGEGSRRLSVEGVHRTESAGGERKLGIEAVMEQLSGIPILSSSLRPSGALAIIFLVPRGKTGAIRTLATAVARLDFLVSIPLWFAFDRESRVPVRRAASGSPLASSTTSASTGSRSPHPPDDSRGVDRGGLLYTAIHEREKIYVLLLLLQPHDRDFCCLDLFLSRVLEVCSSDVFLIGVGAGSPALRAIKFFLLHAGGLGPDVLGIIALTS